MRSVRDIITAFQNALAEQNSPLASFSRYSNIYALLRAVASVVAEQDFKIQSVLNRFYIQTSQGTDLDIRALEYGITRKVGSFAKGKILFRANNFAQVIPRGTILSTADSEFQYELINNATPNSTEATVEVRSLTRSSLANLEAGTRLYSSLFPQVEFIVGQFRNFSTRLPEGGITEGQDSERDEDLRYRLLLHLRSMQKGTLDSLLSKVLGVSGVNRVFIEEHAPVTGYITIFVDSNNTRVLEEVERAVSQNKAAGIAYQVRSIEMQPVNVSLTVRLSNFDNSKTITDQIRTLINQYFNSLSLGDILDPQTLAALTMNIPGVLEARIINPTNLITPNSNVILTLSNLSISING